MKKILIAFAALIIFAGAAFVALPWIVPQSTLERHLAAMLEQEAGLRLTSARSFSLSLFPKPGFAVHEVTVGLPADAAGASQLSAESIFAEINPASLLDDGLRVNRIQIQRPVLEISGETSNQRKKEDVTQLPTGTPSATVNTVALGDAAPIEPAAPPIADAPKREKRRSLPKIDIDVTDGAIFYRDRNVEIKDIHLTLRGSKLDSPVSMNGTAQWHGEPVNLTIMAERSAPDDETIAPLAIRFDAPALEGLIDGRLDLLGPEQFTGEMRVDLLSAQTFTDWIGAKKSGETPQSQPAQLTGKLNISEQGLALTNGRIASANANGDVEALIDFAGQSKASITNLALHGGKAQMKLTLNTHQRDAIFAGALDMENVDHLALTTSLSGFDWLSGRANASITFAGGGKSIADIRESLSGKGNLSIRDGAIEGLDLPFMVAEVQKGELGKWHRDPERRTDFDSLEANFTLEKGVASTEDIALSGPNIELTGKGRTDLTKEFLDYRLLASITASEVEEGAEQGKFTLPFIVKGDWAEPNITPDIEKALQDKDSLLGTAKLFGKSLEKATDGKVKAEDFGKVLDSLFGKKKKEKTEQ